MHAKAALVSLVASLGLANAQFVYTVTVGLNEVDGQPGLGFDPSRVVPAVGDVIHFVWSLPDYITSVTPTAHSVIQSSFDNPCQQLSGGFSTGEHQTTAYGGNGFVQDFNVTSADPVWFSSISNNDCQSGMVFAINPPVTGDQTIDTFKARAQATSPQATTAAPGSATSAATGSASASRAASSSATASSSRAASSGAPSASASPTGAASTVAAASTGKVIAGAIAVAAAFMLRGVVA